MIILEPYQKTNIRLEQLREVKPSMVSFRTIRYSRKKHMEDIAIEFYPNRESTETIYINRLGGESFIEDTLMVLQEHEPSIIIYLPQAMPVKGNEPAKKLEYLREDGINEEWTPDNASLWLNQKPMIIEVKSLSWIKSLSPIEKKKLYHKWDYANKYAEQNGFEFLVFTDGFAKHSWRVENIRDLEAQMRFSKKEHEEFILHSIKDNSNKNWTVKKLQDELESADLSKQAITSALCSLIYHQKIYIDLEKEFRFDKTLLKITNEDVYEIPLYDWLEKYKYHWETENVILEEKEEELGVINRSNHTKYQREAEAKNLLVIKAIENGRHYKKIMKEFGISWGKFQNLRTLYEKKLSKEITEIEYQCALIPQKPRGNKPIRLFDVDKHGKAIFFDLRFKDAIENCFEKKNRMNFENTWRFYKRFKRLDAYQQGLTIRTNETLSKLLSIAKSNPEFKHASSHVFRKEIQRYQRVFFKRVTAKREGLKQANKKSMVVTSATPYTNFIGQMVQIDHSIGDIINKVALPVTIMVENEKIIRGKKHKRHYMVRPTITILEDINTGVILGYAFRYRKPSVETDFQAIRRMVIGNVNPLLDGIDSDKEIIASEKRHSSTIAKIMRGIHELVALGILQDEEYEQILFEFEPENQDNLRPIAEWWDNIRVMPYLLHMDNGKDFTSVAMKKWMAKHQVNAGYRPVGGSQYGGHVERLLGTLNRQAFHSMTGTTKSNTIKRGDYPSEKLAILTFEQLEALLLVAMIRYHAQPHSKHGVSPREKWRQAYEEDGHNIHFLPSGKIKNLTPEFKKRIRQLTWDLLPEKKLKYNQKDGLTHYKIKYNDSILQKYFEDKQKVKIRFSRSDVRFVWWWHPNEDRPIPIWAKKMKLGDRIYNRDQLQRMPPISNLQFNDMLNLPLWKMGMELAEKYERMVNSADNVYYDVYKSIPKSQNELKKIDDNIAKKIDEGRIEAKEIEEMNALLSETDDKVFKVPNKTNTISRRNLKEVQKKDIQKAWQKPVQVKTITIPPRKSNPFTNKKVELKKNIHKKE